jgi:Uma2 family endonuclease
LPEQFGRNGGGVGHGGQKYVAGLLQFRTRSAKFKILGESGVFAYICPAKIEPMKEYTVVNTRPMTVEEYIEFEENSEIRHEFIQNQLIPMSGTTRVHNTICINLAFLLRLLLKNDSYEIFQENVKVQISAGKDYTYPDIVITNDPIDLSGDDAYFIKRPCVIVEVISRSSRIEDSADKFIRYKNIESLQNYVLVDSLKAWVEVRYKTATGDWEANAYLLSDEKFPVPILGIELKLEDVYEGVSFI